MVDQGFSCDPKNAKATETRKTVEPIFRGGGGAGKVTVKF